MKHKPTSNDQLARMVQKGFDESNEQFSEMRLELRAIRKELADVVHRREFEELQDQVKELQDMFAMPRKKAA